MMTPWANKFDKNAPLQEYPRPYLVRDSYINLNGIWDYEITTTNAIPKSFNGKICVPYPLESALSGVGIELKKNEYLCYRKQFEVTKDFINDVVMINFGAVNQICDIYLNGNYAMHHAGGYLPFSLNATQFIKEGNNELNIVAKNAKGKVIYSTIYNVYKDMVMPSIKSASPFNEFRNYIPEENEDKVEVEFEFSEELKEVIFDVGGKEIPYRMVAGKYILYIEPTGQEQILDIIYTDRGDNKICKGYHTACP